jgi:short subunit dehydrogenase-like uncharacterized protein
MAGNFLIYGVNGYTGRLILEEALKKGFRPIIAGRDKKAVFELARDNNDLDYRVFPLENPEQVAKHLDDIVAVIHCAGPFEFTAEVMALACIAKGVHYMDITGEITVFELLKGLEESAKKANVMLLPGSGFDVVPSDCLAAMLKEKMPDAKTLEMAFSNVGGSISHGTASTAIENLGKKNLIRENGYFKEVPMGKLFKWVDFGSVKHHCVSIPWGDVSTAYYSTGIPNVTVYMGIPPSARKWMLLGNWLSPLLRSKAVKNYLKKQLKKRPAGPDAEQRKKAKTLLWGEVCNAKGEKISLLMQTAEGYTLTAAASVLIVTKILNGNFKTGFQTPSLAYGSGLILELGAELTA